MTDGLLVVDKPAGMTSHDVVAFCRKRFGQRGVGHSGTLDPDATGLLLVGLGQATRLLQFLTGLDKSYRGEVVLGQATSTLDSSGEVTGSWDMRTTTIDAAREVAAGLTGDIEQVPPMVSALKVGGRRLHELAREGIEVERQARQVRVHRFTVDLADDQAAPEGAGPVLAVTIGCSSGTYVRTLAADLGAGLGGGAHLRRLRREVIGPWTLADAVALEAVSPTLVHTPLEALRGLTRRSVDEVVADEVRHGRVLPTERLGASGPGPWPVLGPDGTFLAIYREHGEGRVKPVVVLVPAGR